MGPGAGAPNAGSPPPAPGQPPSPMDEEKEKEEAMMEGIQLAILFAEHVNLYSMSSYKALIKLASSLFAGCKVYS